MSLRCFSCRGIFDTKCESVTTEIECPSNGQVVYDSCYTVTKVMDYPVFGRRVEVLKNCSVLADCSFLESLLCNNVYNLINSCSIQCCTGDLCNNKTIQNSASSTTRGSTASVETRANVTQTVTRANITRTATRATMSNNATRTPELTSGINMTSTAPSIRSSTSFERAVTSWTSAKSQEAMFSSASPAFEPTVHVRAVSGSTKRIYVQLPVLLLMTILSSGINFK